MWDFGGKDSPLGRPGTRLRETYETLPFLGFSLKASDPHAAEDTPSDHP